MDPGVSDRGIALWHMLAFRGRAGEAVPFHPPIITCHPWNFSAKNHAIISLYWEESQNGRQNDRVKHRG